MQLGAAVALASINRADADTARIREVMLKIYDSQEKIQRMQVLRAMQHLYDPGTLPFFLTTAKAPEEELPDIRVIAANAYALLANKAEAAPLQGADRQRQAAPTRPRSSSRTTRCWPLPQSATWTIACWTKKLDDKDENVARKATYMLGATRARQTRAAIAALVKKLDDARELVRGDVLSALDFAAVKGSPEAVQKIEKIRKAEEGRAIWNHVKERALSTQARLAVAQVASG